MSGWPCVSLDDLRGSGLERLADGSQFVLATRLAAQAIAARVTRWENLIAGLPLRYPLDPERLPTSATLILDGSDSSLEPRIDRENSPPELLFTDTRTAGFYEAGWDEPGGARQSRLFAATADARDSESTRLSDEALRGFLGRLVPRILRFDGQAMSSRRPGPSCGGYWRQS